MGDMEYSNSKKNMKLLALTLTVMVILMIGVYAAVRLTNFTDGIRGFRSGEFLNIAQTISDDGWAFSAALANGQNVIFANLSCEDMANFKLESSIGAGEMFLLISHANGNVVGNFNLSTGEVAINSESIDMAVFEPGRIQMQLSFVGAENVHVNVSWR